MTTTLATVVPNKMSSPDASLALSFDYVKLAADYLQRHGVSREDYYHRLGFSEVPPDETAMLHWSQAQYRHWVNLLRQLSGSQAIGIELGQQYNIAAHGLLGQIALCSENIWQTVDLLRRYTGLRNRLLSMQWRESGDWAELEISTCLGDPALEQFAVEVATGTLHRLLRFCLRNLEIEESVLVFHFAFPEPAYVESYRTKMRGTLEFDQAQHRIRLPLALCHQPFDSNNQAVLQLIEQQCEARLAQLSGQALLPKARQILFNSVGRFPTQQQLAAQLAMAPRTLRKRLQNQGTSFQAILNEVRYSLASSYLRDSDWPLEVVASMLGFSDRTHFSSAFKRWHGSSPAAFRQSMTLHKRSADNKRMADNKSIAGRRLTQNKPER